MFFLEILLQEFKIKEYYNNILSDLIKQDVIEKIEIKKNKEKCL